jgi:hypothetical protein
MVTIFASIDLNFSTLVLSFTSADDIDTLAVWTGNDGVDFLQLLVGSVSLYIVFQCLRKLNRIDVLADHVSGCVIGASAYPIVWMTAVTVIHEFP